MRGHVQRRARRGRPDAHGADVGHDDVVAGLAGLRGVDEVVARDGAVAPLPADRQVLDRAVAQHPVDARHHDGILGGALGDALEADGLLPGLRLHVEGLIAIRRHGPDARLCEGRRDRREESRADETQGHRGAQGAQQLFHSICMLAHPGGEASAKTRDAVKASRATLLRGRHPWGDHFVAFNTGGTWRRRATAWERRWGVARASAGRGASAGLAPRNAKQVPHMRHTIDASPGAIRIGFALSALRIPPRSPTPTTQKARNRFRSRARVS